MTVARRKGAPGKADMRKRTCSVSGCESKVHAKGLCGRHYQMRARHGDSTHRKSTLLEVFWDRVDVRGPDECWEWLGARMARGYGQPYARLTPDGPRRRVLAHRVAFELANGHSPEGEVCHHCDNPPCCNPNHLYDGSHADNMRDAKERGLMRRGEDSHFATLTVDQVRAIRERAAEGERHADVAADYGVTRQTVGDIHTRRSWGWLR